MTRVAIVADTHVPSRANGVPEWVAEEIERADHAIHAGDFDSSEAYDRIDDLVDGNLTAVSGNMDPPTLSVPSTATVDLDGVTFVVTHGTGSPAGWHERVADAVRAEADATAVGVAGHTHEVVDTTVDGIRVLNPGSATGASPADRETMLVARIEDGRLEVERLAE